MRMLGKVPGKNARLHCMIIHYFGFYSVFHTQLQQGIMEEVIQSDRAVAGNGPVPYLPHHTLICKDKETTKVRIVFMTHQQS